MRNQLRLLRDVSALILIACTWRLWFAASDFPAIPFFEYLAPIPRIVDQVVSSILVAALLVNCCLGIRRLNSAETAGAIIKAKFCDILFVISACGLILLNQHCLQPWMYHFLILIPLLRQRPTQTDADLEADCSGDDGNQSCDGIETSRTAVIWLTASIYVWSAWSKLDASFLQSHGPKLVEAICGAIGFSTRFWTDQTWSVAAISLPLGELIVGVLLLFRKTRRIGLMASQVMHMLLMVAVGPLGLNHEAGVLLWNVFFIMQNIIVLLSERRTSVSAGWSSSDACRTVFLVLAGCTLFPGFRTIGWCDTWPAWAVYASSPARVLVQVHDDVVETLPDDLQPYIERRQIADGWSWIRIEKWSLEATGTPIYPEDRFQLGVALALTNADILEEGIRIVHQSEADRWTGERSILNVQSSSDLKSFAARYTLGTLPR